MKKLVAGPWVGEFGWELLAWHAYIRALSRKFDHTTIISRKNSKSLYEDFVDKYIVFEPPDGHSDAFFMHNVDIHDCFKRIVKGGSLKLDENVSLILPRRIGIPPHTHYTEHVVFGKYVIQPEYISFGSSCKKSYDFIFHIRSRPLRSADNWDLKNWKKLKKLLGDENIACIGTKKESGWLKGTDDLRDIDLKELLNILKNSGCVFGPSSGPMHLASLCGTPHVVWSKEDNRVRYEENWNPLKTKVLFDSEYDWHPSPEHIYKNFSEWR